MSDVSGDVSGMSGDTCPAVSGVRRVHGVRWCPVCPVVSDGCPMVSGLSESPNYRKLVSGLDFSFINFHFPTVGFQPRRVQRFVIAVTHQRCDKTSQVGHQDIIFRS